MRVFVALKFRNSSTAFFKKKSPKVLTDTFQKWEFFKVPRPFPSEFRRYKIRARWQTQAGSFLKRLPCSEYFRKKGDRKAMKATDQINTDVRSPMNGRDAGGCDLNLRVQIFCVCAHPPRALPWADARYSIFYAPPPAFIHSFSKFIGSRDVSLTPRVRCKKKLVVQGLPPFFEICFCWNFFKVHLQVRVFFAPKVE